ncbi:MAG TPA: L,D-transpeptidase/peptidoglycan binding protein [Actinomycetota bacterium]|nr:L,D-transpeptidase/peptidoglycan binding protein [Actinomycetota bacterium]
MTTSSKDVTPNHGGFWSRLPRPRLPRPGRKTAIAIGVLLALLLLGGAGAAYATMEYSEEYEGRILPGSSIAGVSVGGMDREEAVEAVKSAIGPQLDRPIELSWKKKSWTVTPRELGARSNAEKVVDAAFAASGDASFFEKMQMRFLDHDLEFDRRVGITYPRQGARGFIEGIAKNVDAEATDAAIDYSSGWVEITPEQVGHTVQVDRAHRALMRALRNDTDEVALPVKDVKPEVRQNEFDQILLVRIGENKLYLYEDGAIVREWSVATGQPEYMTPTGLWEVTELRYMPTWVNPAPTTWGASMPASIPPGPGNPLGLRAINWSAPAIRFHGTSATYSLGYNASHGCVRMANEDVIELYDMVEVGTPIVSVVAGPLKPLYSSAPDPTPVAENADDTAPTSGPEDANADSSDGDRDGKSGKKDD